MSKMYRLKGDASIEPFNVVQGKVVVSVDELLSVKDAITVFTRKAIDLAATMLEAWETYKDKLEPVEGE